MSRGQLAFIVVLVILIIFGLLMVHGKYLFGNIIYIGEQHGAILRAYAEGEAIREYIERAVRQATYTAFEDDCPTAPNTNTILEYLHAYSSPNNFTVNMPNYKWQITKEENAILIEGIPDKQISISSKKYKFDYSLLGYIKERITCEEFKRYVKYK